MKREQMMEERYAKIERENRLLLEKMSHIMQGGNSIDNKNDAHKYAGGMNKSCRKAGCKKVLGRTKPYCAAYKLANHVTIIWSGKKIA